MPDAEPDERAARGQLTDLTPNECWELLGTRPVGRLVWSGASGLTVVPLNYAVREGRILLRTAAYTSLARECRDREVAFQVDDIDADSHSGWSVLVRGYCRDVAAGSDDQAPDTWASGTRRVVFAVEAQEVTGRRLTAG
jgi:nitroimidazol reductase NimA-like FMN-containing flavoprotein (pyridoxamine 5'-phosphate oxidase superfamily)